MERRQFLKDAGIMIFLGFTAGPLVEAGKIDYEAYENNHKIKTEGKNYEHIKYSKLPEEEKVENLSDISTELAKRRAKQELYLQQFDECMITSSLWMVGTLSYRYLLYPII